MPKVALTSHLYRFFPELKNRDIEVPAGSVREILVAMDQLASGFSDYVLDEHGALRRHVNICVNDTLVIDRQHLRDHVPDSGTLYIFQALSGG